MRNDFALHAVPEVIESEHAGRVIYAGGDDVLAILPVAHLIPVMQRLRQVYSGHDSSSADLDWRQARRNPRLAIKDGFGLLRGRLLLRLMGEKATASCGAVIAHHQAPLAAVLRELRAGAKHQRLEPFGPLWGTRRALVENRSFTVTRCWQLLVRHRCSRYATSDPGRRARDFDRSIRKLPHPGP
jgi:hypothetical protein